MNGPLDGVRVLDLSRVLAGPTATQVLGDLGADVVKLEHPTRGDDTRRWGPPFVPDAHGHPTAESTYSLCANRNKRSIAADLSTEGGRATVLALMAVADVVVENFKPGSLARLGLAHPDLRERFPKLVWCSITGHGETGPDAAKPGYDLLAQARAGVMSITGAADGEPAKVGVAVCDTVTGLYAVIGILAALRHAESTGRGQHLDLSLLDCTVSWLANQATAYLQTGEVPVRRGNAHPSIVPYQPFSTSDGRVVLGIGNDAQFRRWCAAAGVPAWADDPRFRSNVDRLAHREELVARMGVVFSGRTTAEWLGVLTQADLPHGPVNDLAAVFADPQVLAREMVVSMAHPPSGGTVRLVGSPLKLSETPVSYRRAPPALGEHTDDVRRDWLT